jgi:hypothetical protein
MRYSLIYAERAGNPMPRGQLMKASRIRYTVVLLAISLAVLSYVQRVAISVAAGPRALATNRGAPWPM